MKIMSIVRLATLSFLTLFIQQDCAATISFSYGKQIVGMTEYKGLLRAFSEANLIREKSTEIADKAREHLLNKDATQAEDLQNVKIIIKHVKVYVMAIQKAKKMHDEILKIIYRYNFLDKFIAGVKNVRSGIASFFTAGTGTEEQKAIARLIIKELTGKEVLITQEYLLLQKDLTAVEKAQLKSRYDTVIAQIEAAIYEQKIITGNTKSNKIKSDLLLEFVVARENAREIIKNAHEHILNKDTMQLEDLQNIKNIIEQNKFIMMAIPNLEKMRDEIEKRVAKGNVSEGYLDKFVAGVKNVGAGIASFFMAGTTTEEEKRIARLIIQRLTFEKQQIAYKYALLQKDLTTVEKDQLKSRYDAVIAQIEAAIYEQQIITGDTKK